MIFQLIILFVVILVPNLYKSYVPVKNIPYQKNNRKDHSAILLDIRAYNQKTG